MFKHSFSLCMCCEMSNFILQSMDFIKKNLIKINRTLMFLDIHQKVRLFFRCIYGFQRSAKPREILLTLPAPWARIKSPS